VLALQGDFREHIAVVRGLGAEAVPVRRPGELDGIRGLIIPGGESSVMDKLARTFGLFEPLKTAIAQGLPVYGTCAGLIMLADRLIDAIDGQRSLGGFDVSVRRNAFGSQLDSFETDIDIPVLGEAPMHAVFIRAPVVESVGEAVKVLGSLGDDRRHPVSRVLLVEVRLDLKKFKLHVDERTSRRKARRLERLHDRGIGVKRAAARVPRCGAKDETQGKLAHDSAVVGAHHSTCYHEFC